MSDTDVAKRKHSEKLAYAINSIEGFPVPYEVKAISAQWVKGEITDEQMHAQVLSLFHKILLKISLYISIKGV